MPSTGDECVTEGDYSGTCHKYSDHRQTSHFTVGDTFTPCSTSGGEQNKPGGAVMNWVLVRAGR